MKRVGSCIPYHATHIQPGRVGTSTAWTAAICAVGPMHNRVPDPLSRCIAQYTVGINEHTQFEKPENYRHDYKQCECGLHYK